MSCTIPTETLDTIDAGTIIALLDKFNRQRPGLELGNYGDATSYRAELRSIARDKRDADTLLCAVARVCHQPIDWINAFSAFSGRLSLILDAKGRPALDYCTGQYFPTEYRRAVAAVCATVLWDRYRDDMAAAKRPGESEGDAVRRGFRRMFGRSLANRWFN